MLPLKVEFRWLQTPPISDGAAPQIETIKSLLSEHFLDKDWGASVVRIIPPRDQDMTGVTYSDVFTVREIDSIDNRIAFKAEGEYARVPWLPVHWFIPTGIIYVGEEWSPFYTPYRPNERPF